MPPRYSSAQAQFWNRNCHKSGVALTIIGSESADRVAGTEVMPALPPDRGVGAMPIASLLANTSFDPEAVENLSAAFDDAWEKFKQSGSSSGASRLRARRPRSPGQMHHRNGATRRARSRALERIRAEIPGAELQTIGVRARDRDEPRSTRPSRLRRSVRLTRARRAWEAESRCRGKRGGIDARTRCRRCACRSFFTVRMS